TQTFEFTVDKTLPILELISKNNTKVSNRLDIQVSVTDQNLPKSDYLSFLLPSGKRIVDETIYYFDTSKLEDGDYHIEIVTKDLAQNYLSSKIHFTIDHSIIDPPKTPIRSTPILNESDVDFVPILLVIIAVIAIVSGIVIFKQKSKIPQKN
ncbi:MAG: hypothetical protein VYC45_01290, partial [Thermoproteota archaeon]|nr:hypothetical protein [Thermoproteota archaeon]